MDIRDYIERQIWWSRRTFGEGMRTGGLCRHIEKELAEIQAVPGDLEEWIDVIILGLDGAWRSGYTTQQILDTLELKQRKNFMRQWPAPVSQDEPVEHVRSEP